VSGEARRLIAVDGIDGSGKTMLADRLLAVLAQAGTPAVLLRVDDFRRPIAWGHDARGEADLYYEDYYDLALLERGARAFLECDSGFELPVFDSRTERHQGRRTIAFDGAPLALIEGVFAQRVAAVRQSAAIVYIETSREEARRRILARDMGRGRTIADVTHRIDARYFPAQDRYVREHDPLAHADALIVHERTGAPDLIRADAGRLGGALWAALRRVVASFAPSGPVG
jgi:uridine kinase